MKIPDELMDKWKVLRSSGDTSKMAERLISASAETFNRAFRIGKCRDEVFQIMAEFYEQKSSLIKEYL